MKRALELRETGVECETRSYALELRAAGDDGTVEGYGSVFGVRDNYDDVIAAGAFAASLKEHKAAGTMPAMLWQHSPDEPIGVWEEIAEDAKGLRVKGRLALDTARGREAHALLKMGALNGLSIGFVARAWRYENEDVRVLTEIDLWEVSLVTFPANAKARITQVKTVSEDDVATAIRHLTAAIKLHEAHMDGSEPTSEESQMRMMKMMKAALAALKKSKGTDDMEDMGESVPSPKNAERILREAGFSKADATAFVSRVMRMGEERRESAQSTAQAMRAANRLLEAMKK